VAAERIPSVTGFLNSRGGNRLKKLFVGSLPPDATEEAIAALFSEYGRVRSIHLANDVFSGKCKGFGFVEMEGHEARAAIAGLDGKRYGDRNLKVKFEVARGKKKRRR
jgi:RNA recognition motif-containing protein